MLGPIPDNQSANGNREATFGFGDHQGLYVHDGLVVPAWSSDRNGDPDPRVNPNQQNGQARLDIRLAHARIASGPRVVSGSMGPVATTTADGRPEARSLIVTFDRRVDPDTFKAADVTLFARDSAGNPLAVQPVATLVSPIGANAVGAFQFQVDFTAVTTPGTISYAIGPDINDRIRQANGDGTATLALGNQMDQDGDGLEGETTQDVFDAPRRRQPSQTLFTAPYVRDTQPLIVPGPHVVASSIPGLTDGGDDLALRRSVSALNVTFDWPMQVGTFTTADILRVYGPAGTIYDATGTGARSAGRSRCGRPSPWWPTPRSPMGPP